MLIYKLRAMSVFGSWHESLFMTRELAMEYLRRAIIDGDFIETAEHTITSVWVSTEI